jgi:hypothetical protein
MAISQCDASEGHKSPMLRALSLFLVVKQGFPGRAGVQRGRHGNNDNVG